MCRKWLRRGCGSVVIKMTPLSVFVPEVYLCFRAFCFFELMMTQTVMTQDIGDKKVLNPPFYEES